MPVAVARPALSPVTRQAAPPLYLIPAGAGLLGYLVIAGLCGVDLPGAVRFFAGAGLYLILPGCCFSQKMEKLCI